MRAIPLRTVPIKAGAQEMLDYAAAIAQVIEAKAEGMTLAEMRHVCAVLGAIEAAVAAGRKEALIEEADWKHLCDRLMAHRWPFAAVSVRDMVDAVLGASPHDPNSAAAT